MAEQLSPKLVLVIEDHSVLLAILADLLRRERLEVVEAVDGGAGIELAKRHRPDLIISDYWMPTASGVDVLQAVRQDNATAGIPFLMLTADTSPALRRKVIALGADAFLNKSVDLKELLGEVWRLLSEPERQSTP